MGLDYFFHDYVPLCDRWILADNSEIPFTVVAEGSKNGINIIRDKEKFDVIYALGQKVKEDDKQ
jgi:predicted ABC-type ATPase